MTDRLVHELRRGDVGDVYDHDAMRGAYSSDASHYRVVPQAVAFPRSREEVHLIVAMALELEVPVTARGAGTSVARNAIGPGIVPFSVVT